MAVPVNDEQDGGYCHQTNRSDERLSLVLMTLELAMGFVAFICGWLLMVNGLGMSRTTLVHSPFTSFLVPGLVLAVGVGGSMLLAARMIWFRHTLAPAMSLIAGLVLFGWILVEAVMVRDGRPLQLGVLAYAIAVIGLAWTIHGGSDTWADDETT